MGNDTKNSDGTLEKFKPQNSSGNAGISAKRHRQTSQLAKIAAEYLEMQENEAREAGALGYLGRCVIQATLPHSNPKPEYSFERRNGSYTFSIVAPKSIGLPYGIIPRLILIWISGEVVRTQDPHLVLGDHLSQFMEALGLGRTGGVNGSITALREQAKRLFKSTISFTSENEEHDKDVGYRLSEEYYFWKKKTPANQSELFPSWVDLTPRFFTELRDFSVPIDLRRVKMLRRSPLALDIYTWWTYRFSYLRRQTEVPWEALYVQFGANYQAMFHFREAFRAALARAHKAYPEANISEGKHGLILRPSRTSIPKLLPQSQPTIATKKRADEWTKRHPGKFQKLLRELELMKEASVGANASDWEAGKIRRAQLASERASVPIDIAYRLLGVENTN